MTFKINPETALDSYKIGHADQYPTGTELVVSNFTPRSVKHLNIPKQYKREEVVFVGLQGALRELIELWDDNFFKVPYADIEARMVPLVAPFVGPRGYNMERIKQLHAYGRLPITVRALPEGSRVPVGVPCFTIQNVGADYYWLTNALETILSCELWMTMTNATIADAYKRILLTYANRTGAPLDFVMWQGHDFSMRGMSSVHSAAKSGSGHLASFYGTDCPPAVSYLLQYYRGAETFVGGSVPATEHSVMGMCALHIADSIESILEENPTLTLEEAYQHHLQKERCNA